MLKISVFNFKSGIGKGSIDLDWLTADSDDAFAPLITNTKNLALIPSDIGVFRLQTDSDLFPPSLNCLIGYDVRLMECSPSLEVALV